MSNQYDLIVIGAGPGGYVAAIRAAQLGMKAAVIEANHLGGICLNWGCIPTKALLRCSEINHLLNHVGEYGFKISGLEFDFNKIVERSRKVSKQLSSGIQHLLKKNKVTVIDGYARFNKSKNIEVSKDGKSLGEYKAPHIIIATGARARQLEGLESDGKLIWSYKEAMTPKNLPKSLLVVGSGAIGIEFASFYKNMGTNVTVVEIMDRVMPVEDHEISDLARKSFEKQGMKIITGAKVNKLDKGSNSVTAHIEAGGTTKTQEFERVIMAVGITGNSDDLGLENVPNVKLDRGHIQVNEWLQTGEKGIYAIGDVVSPPWLAHKASHEGIICVEKIANLKDVHPLEVTNIPGCTYCMPQVASVGLTEKAALDKGYEIKIGRFPFIGNGKAIALGETEGLVKTIFDKKTGELLGAHMIGAEVTELIQGFGIAKTLESTEIELMHTVFPHPTLSEMMHESVLDAYDKVIHF
jgi:dihydrolipoamide dehydrogenase